jgi:hypothetical protein
MSWAIAVILYILGLHLAYDAYNTELDIAGLPREDKVDKASMIVTCLLWPVVELRSLFDKGEEPHGE